MSITSLCSHCSKFNGRHSQQILNVIPILVSRRRESSKITISKERLGGSSNTKSILKSIRNAVSWNEIKDIEHSLSYTNSKNLHIRIALIEYYGKYGDMTNAQRIFHFFPIKHHDPVCIGIISVMMKTCVDSKAYDLGLKIYENSKYTNAKINRLHILCLSAKIQTLISGKQYKKALDVYQNIPISKRDNHFHSMAIKICCYLNDYQAARQVIDGISGRKSIALNNTLIHFHAHFKDIESADSVFNHMTVDDCEYDIITMTSMMGAYMKCSYYTECIQLFNHIMEGKYAHITADVICFIIVLSASINGNLVHDGIRIHQILMKQETFLQDVRIQTALINMYGKFGYLKEAQTVYNSFRSHDVSVCNAMINVLSRNGEGMKAYNLFKDMCSKKQTDQISFVSILNACAHNKMVCEAQIIWNEMIKDVETKYDENIFGSFTDCLSRNNHLDVAFDAILKYEQYHEGKPHNYVIWMSLLSGCHKFKNKTVGNRVFSAMRQRFEDHNADNTMQSATRLISNINSDSTQPDFKLDVDQLLNNFG